MSKLRFSWNPIIIKELRSRMRGARAFIVLTIFLLLLGLVSYGLYKIMTLFSGGYYGGPPLLSAHVGLVIFAALAFFELLLVCFITPALTSGIISGERERLTYEILLVTPLRPHSILWGKFVSALVYVLLLIFAAVPMTSLVFIFGGVAPADILQVLIVLLITAVTLGAVGLFFSALLTRTMRATVIAYAVIIVLIVAPSLLYIVWGVVSEWEPPRAILYLNPFAAMGSALPITESGPMWNGPWAILLMPFMPSALFGGFSGPGGQRAALRPIWQYTMFLYLGLTLLCYLLSAQLVQPIRRWRIGWKGVLLLALILFLYGGGAYAFFRRDGLAAWTAPPRPPTPAPMEMVVEERVAVRVVAPPAPPSPTPTPAPASGPFDASEHQTELEDYLAQHLLPAGETAFCDLFILGSSAASGIAEVSAWACCRTFRVADGELVSDLVTSVPVLAELYWTADQEWQIERGYSGSLCELFTPEIQRRLIEIPYDEQAGEERLWERARKELGGE